MIPFRPSTPPPRLREGYRLLVNPWPTAEALNALITAGGEAPRTAERWRLALERSLWHLGVEGPDSRLVGFVRATSDLALNANLWDLSCVRDDSGAGHGNGDDTSHDEVLRALVQAALGRLRRELSGCSVSLSAPPESLKILERQGFLVDPGGIRAMGLRL